jgi:IS4 transposase
MQMTFRNHFAFIGFCPASKEAAMNLPPVLESFAKGSPLTVMVRAALDWLVDEVAVDEIFDEAAVSQYTRELTLSHMVDVILDVATGIRPSPRAAFRARELDRAVSAAAFYGKLSRMEPDIAVAVVAHTAAQARAVITASCGTLDEPVAGYSARILDGNVLSGSEHRIAPLRKTRAAGLPGKLLAVFEPVTGLVLQYVPCEDAYTQERALLDQVEIEAGQLWIADRNFCVRGFLERIVSSRAFFLIRRHGSSLPFTPKGPLRHIGRVETGEVFEQEIAVEGSGAEHTTTLRRIVLVLDKPTTDGDTEIELITNLPASVAATTCCAVYRERWQIERHFQTMTDLLHCEIPALGQPRAALFAFGMSLVASHALAMIEASLREAHGEEPVKEMSRWHFVDEVSHVYRGMMLAIPPSVWQALRTSTAAEMAAMLNAVAGAVRIDRMQKSRRGPKKPRNTPKSPHRHRSTKRLMDEEQAARRRKKE